jgi:hypothetical protein
VCVEGAEKKPAWLGFNQQAFDRVVVEINSVTSASSDQRFASFFGGISDSLHLFDLDVAKLNDSSGFRSRTAFRVGRALHPSVFDSSCRASAIEDSRASVVSTLSPQTPSIRDDSC